MTAEIRRTLLHIQTTRIEGGKPLEVPTKLVAAMAILRNPWFGPLDPGGLDMQQGAANFSGHLNVPNYRKAAQGRQQRQASPRQ